MAPRKDFSKELDFLLIAEVQRRRLLWDCTLEIYRRKDLKATAWEQVAAALGPKVTADAASDRWKNMKQTYMNNNKNVWESKNKCSGSDGVNTYIPKWPLFNYLHFIKKTCAQAESTSNLSATQPTEQCSQKSPGPNSYFDDNTGTFLTIPPDIENQNEYDPGSSGTEDTLTTLLPVTLAPPIQSSPSTPALLQSPSASPDLAAVGLASSSAKQNSREKLYENRGQKRKSSALLDEAVQVMKKMSQPILPPPEEDSADVFGSFIASRLRAIPDKDKRKDCENDLLMVITRY